MCAQEVAHDDAYADPKAGYLFDHAMAVEMSSLKMLEAFGFFQTSISTLQFHPEAPKSVGLILLSKMTQVLFYPYAHLIRKCLNSVGVSNYMNVLFIHTE